MPIRDRVSNNYSIRTWEMKVNRECRVVVNHSRNFLISKTTRLMKLVFISLSRDARRASRQPCQDKSQRG
jgi:hypothetical protein